MWKTWCSYWISSWGLSMPNWETLRPYALHTRPLSFVFVGVHLLAGQLTTGSFSPTFLLAFFSWVICLNGGTLALNSVFDKDEGNIGLLKNPPPIPEYLFHFSCGLLALGFLTALLLTPFYAVLYTISLILSVLYSVPPIKLKSRYGYDIMVNMVGYGALTFMAGFASTGVPVQTDMLLLTVAFFFLFGSFYPTTQIYQIDVDRNNKDNTFVVHFGSDTSLVYACWLALAAYVFFMIAFGLTVSAIVLTSMTLVWLGTLHVWRKRIGKNDEQKMYYFLVLWLIADVTVMFSA